MLVKAASAIPFPNHHFFEKEGTMDIMRFFRGAATVSNFFPAAAAADKLNSGADPESGNFEPQQKTIGYIFGEKVVKPAIDRAARVFSTGKWVFDSIGKVTSSALLAIRDSLSPTAQNSALMPPTSPCQNREKLTSYMRNLSFENLKQKISEDSYDRLMKAFGEDVLKRVPFMVFSNPDLEPEYALFWQSPQDLPADAVIVILPSGKIVMSMRYEMQEKLYMANVLLDRGYWVSLGANQNCEIFGEEIGNEPLAVFRSVLEKRPLEETGGRYLPNFPR